MPKASIKLPNGTAVQIEGSPEEIANLLMLYSGSHGSSNDLPVNPSEKSNRKPTSRKTEVPVSEKSKSDSPSLATIVETIKNCKGAESIETTVLDKTGQVNRILLPLFIVHEHMANAYGLTSGEVSQVMTDLGIPIRIQNASTTLSGTASRYVIGDKIRQKSQAVRYKLSRRGLKYFKEVLSGASDGK